MLRLDKISKEYENNKEFTLNNIDLFFGDTGFYSIIGPSGSGKTTLINLISLLDNPTSGEIYYNNETITKFSKKEESIYRSSVVDIIFQDFNLIEKESVKFNLLLACNNKNSEDDLEKALMEVGLNGFINRKVYTLSQGEKQRVAIARSLLKRSRILLCDEPTGNLDDENSSLIFQLLKDISKKKLVIVVTHDKERAKDFSNYVYELSKGKIKNPISKNTLNYKESTELEDKTKMNLSFRKTFMLAIDNLKNSIFSLVFVFFILVSQFSLFISLFALNSYSKLNASVENYYKNKQYIHETFLMKDNNEYDQREKEYYGPRVFLEEEKETDLEKIKNDEKDLNVFPSYHFNIMFDDFLADKESAENIDDYFTNYFTKIFVLETFDNFHQPLLKGKYPQNEGEIVLYDYMAASLAKYGVVNEDNIVDSNIIYHGVNKKYQMKIVGILESQYLKFYKVYQNVLNDNHYKQVDYIKYYLQDLKSVFCLKETFLNLKETYDFSYFKPHTIEFPEYEGCNSKCLDRIFQLSQDNVVNYLENAYMKMEDLDKLSEGIVISKKMALDFANVSNIAEAQKKQIGDYKKLGLEGLIGDFIKIEYSFYSNSLQTGTYTKAFFQIIGIVDEDIKYPVLFNYYDYFIKNEQPFKYRHTSLSLTSNWSKNKEIINRHLPLEKKDNKFYESAKDDWFEQRFCFYNNVSLELNNYDYFFKDTKKVAIIISSILLVASFFSLLFFSFMCINKNMYKISLLVSLGYSKGSVARLYIFTFFLCFALSFIFAIPIGFIIVNSINSIYAGFLSTLIYYFSIPISAIFIGFAISLFVFSIGCSYPILKMYKTPIIKSIRRNKIK